MGNDPIRSANTDSWSGFLSFKSTRDYESIRIAFERYVPALPNIPGIAGVTDQCFEVVEPAHIPTLRMGPNIIRIITDDSRSDLLPLKI